MNRPRRQDPFSELFGEFGDRLGSDHWRPHVDVFETEKAVLVRLEISGVHAADLRVTVDEDVLHVRGHRRPPADADVQRLHQMEIAFGPFERSVRITVPFDREAVGAHLEDGFLCVTLPKRLPSRHRVAVENLEGS